MQLRIEIIGEIVERSQLLNGTESVTIDGASGETAAALADAGEWTLVGAFSWNLGLVDYAGEGDLTLSRSDGAEIFGTLTVAHVADAADDADHTFRLEYEIDGGAGEFARAAGTATAEGTLAGSAIRGIWSLSLSDP